MITRVWHGRTSLEKADAYLHFLLGEGTREYRETPGNISVKVWSSRGLETCDFFTVTEWNEIDSVKKFAGEDHEKAVYYPGDEDVLIELETSVKHYDSRDVSTFRVKQYIRQLDELHHGGSWQGESFSAKLDDLTEEQAFTSPIAGVHGIAEIVWHCIYWRTVLLRRFAGDHAYRDQTMQQMNFRPVAELKGMGWMTLKKEFDDKGKDIETWLRSKHDGFLSEEYADGKTYEHLVEGIIQHDVYHLGQIGLVRKMITMP